MKTRSVSHRHLSWTPCHSVRNDHYLCVPYSVKVFLLLLNSLLFHHSRWKSKPITIHGTLFLVLLRFLLWSLPFSKGRSPWNSVPLEPLFHQVRSLCHFTLPGLSFPFLSWFSGRHQFRLPSVPVCPLILGLVPPENPGPFLKPYPWVTL